MAFSGIVRLFGLDACYMSGIVGPYREWRYLLRPGRVTYGKGNRWQADNRRRGDVRC